MGGKCFTELMDLVYFRNTGLFFAADTFHRKAIKEIKSLWFHKNFLNLDYSSLGL